MAFAHVQTIGTAGGFANASSGNVTLNGVTAGSMLVLQYTHLVNTLTVVSITDDKGNTWAEAHPPTSSGSPTGGSWYAKAVASGNTVMTITFSGSVGANACQLLVHEYSYGAADVTVEDTVTAGQSATQTWNAGNVDLAGAGLIVAGGRVSAAYNFTAGSGYTERLNGSRTLTEDQIISGAGTYAVDGSMSANQTGVMWGVAFKEVASGLSIPVAMNQYRQRWG
jgi:hypothetical protein